MGQTPFNIFSTFALAACALPRVAYGRLHLLPRCLRATEVGGPSTSECNLDVVVPIQAAILEASLDAVLVCRTIKRIAAVGDRVGTRRVMLAPERIFGRPTDVGRTVMRMVQNVFLGGALGEVASLVLSHVAPHPRA